MKTSTDRIMTTHAGSLPRPPELLKLVRAKLAGQPYDEKELAAEVTRSVEAPGKDRARTIRFRNIMPGRPRSASTRRRAPNASFVTARWRTRVNNKSPPILQLSKQRWPR